MKPKPKTRSNHMSDMLMRLFEWIDTSRVAGALLLWIPISIFAGLMFGGWVERRKGLRVPKGWKEQAR